MKNLRLLIAAAVMTVGLGLMTPAFAELACNPGEMMGPPCSTLPLVNNDSTNPGITATPPVAENIDLTSVATEVLTALLLF
jgi:hypothetical protein